MKDPDKYIIIVPYCSKNEYEPELILQALNHIKRKWGNIPFTNPNVQLINPQKKPFVFLWYLAQMKDRVGICLI